MLRVMPASQDITVEKTDTGFHIVFKGTEHGALPDKEFVKEEVVHNQLCRISFKFSQIED